MTRAGFEPVIQANERLWTHVLDPAATEIGKLTAVTVLTDPAHYEWTVTRVCTIDRKLLGK